MLRGYRTFKCPKCGHKFVGPDMELRATVDTMPLSCPKCGHGKCLPSTSIVDAIKDCFKVGSIKSGM